ncbi:MAG: cation transporter [Candidatus Meridianibacter frigidus]|nr:MAG: cation transporter [Candidatus Eremiobacteraeota bacterium]
MNARTRLLAALGFTALAAIIEAWGGWRAHSLALLSDAAHVCMDAFALAVALLVAVGAQRGATARQTFGYGRLEILGALANGVILLSATVFIIIEAVHRFGAPVQPGGPLMATIAAMGLSVNVLVAVLLRTEQKHNLNVAAALYHVMGDALGALAVIVGGVVIAYTGSAWIDPALSLFVAGIIILGITRVLRDCAHILLESVPQSMNVAEIDAQMSAIDGVVEVHDLHVWTIGTRSYALAAHVLLNDRRLSEATAISDALEKLLRERYGIGHVTLQFECETCEPDQRIICTQLAR